MDVLRTLGENVRRYRTRAKLTQAQVAVKMGVDRAYISSIERGRQNVTVITLWHVAQVLGVHLAQLLADGPEATQ